MISGDGDCFKVTTAVMVGPSINEFYADLGRPVVLNEKSMWRVVHGLVVGTSGIVAGLRYWHAWIEVELPGGPTVIDFSNGHEYKVPRETYYRIGQLDEDHVWRFTPAEARRLFRKLQHGGPWVKGWEKMGDEHRIYEGADG